MTYDELLAAQPSPLHHGNFALAAVFVQQVSDALQDPARPWTTSQRAYLYRLYRKWWRRANGHDLRWNLMAPRPGRPSKRPPPVRAADGETLDALSQRLIDKYGKTSE